MAQHDRRKLAASSNRRVGSRSFILARAARRAKAALMAMAALPLFQATGCFPDPIGALNFELQNLVNITLITAINTIVQNILRL